MCKNLMFLLFVCIGIDNVMALERYQIELLVVENKQASIEKKEAGIFNTGMLDLKQTQSLNGKDLSVSAGALITLPQARYQLLKVVKTIQNSRDQRVVHHIAWEQTLQQDSYAVPVYVNGGKIMSFGNHDKPSYEIEGTLAIMPSRNMFKVKVDFIFNKKLQAAITTSFRLTHNGNLRSNEVYYFDHPSFGIFVMVKPVAEKFID